MKTETKSSIATFEELYAKKDYKGAIDFLLANKQQFNSGTFHYNLGTTYAKMNELGAARFHLEKAALNGMYNSALYNNLQYVNAKIVGEDISTSQSIVDRAVDYSVSIPREAYLTISLALMILFLVILKFKNIKSRVLILIWVLIAFLPSIYIYSLDYTTNVAVALKEVSILEGPSKVFQEKGKIQAGAKVILGEYKEGWFFIKYPISLSGWVSKENLGIL